MRALLLLFVFAVRLLAAEPLKVGMDMSYPPFEMRDEQGQPAGVSVDLARMLGEKLGRPVEFQNLPFDGLIPALKTGRVHLLLSSMTATEERATTVDFSDPYLRTGLCLLVGAKSAITSVADLEQPGRKVAVVKATTGHLWAMKNLKQAQVLVLAKETACALEVAQGKADAFIYDQMSTLRNAQRNPETTRAILKPFKEESWAIALRKGDDALRTQLNTALAALRQEGAFDRLAEKWLKEQKAGFEKLGVPFVF
jgi:polar amino acid transport system substrate-binding protein